MVHADAPAVREFGGIQRALYTEIVDSCISGSESLPSSILEASIKTQSNYMLSISKSKYSVKGGLLLTGGRYLMIREEAEDILKAFHSRYAHRYPIGRIKHVLSATVTYDLFGNGTTGSIQRDYEYICSMCPKCNQNAAVPVEKGPNKQAKTRIRVRVVATGGSPMFNLELGELTPKPNDEIVVKEVVSKPIVYLEPSTVSSKVVPGVQRSQEPESTLNKMIQKPKVYLEPSTVTSRVVPGVRRSQEPESALNKKIQKPRLLGVYLEPSFVSSRVLPRDWRSRETESTIRERMQGVYLELSTNRSKVLRRVGRREAPERTPREECDVAYKDDTMELQPAETVPIPNLADFNSVEITTNRSEVNVETGEGGGAQGKHTDSVSPVVVSSQRRVRMKMDSRKDSGLKMKRKHKDTINTGDIPSTRTKEVIKKKSSVKDEVPDPEREEENDGGQIMNPEVNLETSTASPTVLRRSPEPETTLRKECDVARKDRTNEIEPTETVQSLLDFIFGKFTTTRTEVKADNDEGGSAQCENTGIPSTAPMLTMLPVKKESDGENEKPEEAVNTKICKRSPNVRTLPSAATSGNTREQSGHGQIVIGKHVTGGPLNAMVQDCRVQELCPLKEAEVKRETTEGVGGVQEVAGESKQPTAANNEGLPVYPVHVELEFGDRGSGERKRPMNRNDDIPSTAPTVSILVDKERDGENESHCADGESVTAKKKRPSEQTGMDTCGRLEAKVEVKEEVVEEEQVDVAMIDSQVREIAAEDSIIVSAEVPSVPIQYPDVDSADVRQSLQVQYPDVVNAEVPSLPVHHPETQEVEDPVGRAVLAYVAQMNQPPVPFLGLVAPTAPKTVLLPTPTSGRFPYRPPILYKYGHYWPPPPQ